MKKLLQLAAPLLLCPVLGWAVCSKPIITAQAATPGLDGVSVIISFTTNVPADSTVGVGIGPGNDPSAVTDATGVLTHSVPVTGLFPNTTYGWEIRARAIDAGSVCPSDNWAFYGDGNSATFVTHAAPTGVFDYYIVPEGPHHVSPGYNLRFDAQVGALVGSNANNTLKLVVTGMPANSKIHWPARQDWAQVGTVSQTNVVDDTFLWYQIQDTEIELITNSGGVTPAGTYPLTLTASGAGLPTHSATWSVVVDADPFGIPSAGFIAPVGSAAPPSSFSAIPNLATWVAAMTTYGPWNCAEDMDSAPRTVRANDNANLCVVSPGQNRCAWYYDGVRVYYSIEDYLGTPGAYAQCRSNLNAVYRDGYVINNNGAIQLFTAFPEGIFTDYQRTSAAADLVAIDDLAAHPYNPSKGVALPVRYLQREVPYSLKEVYFENKLGRSQAVFGQNSAYWQAYYLDVVLGHIDQICLSHNPHYWESFMVGLEADILITYFEDGHQSDVRIPSAIKCVADYMWSNAFSVVSGDGGTFQYSNWRGATNEGIVNSGASANVLEDMLIAPMYAWLYKETGNTAYQTEYQTIFGYGAVQLGADGQGGGLSNTIGSAYPGNPAGKEFSQYFYWSSKGVGWDTAPVVPGSAVNVVPGLITLNRDPRAGLFRF